VQLSEIADAWKQIRATRSRKAKAAGLAAVLRALPASELAAGTAILAGEARQGRIGVGWATLANLDVPAADQPTLTVGDVDALLDRAAAIRGAGSQRDRHAVLISLFGRATATEQAYLRGLLLGELRQGALEGVVVEAVAEAAGVTVEQVRRGAMLTGDLTATAVTAMTSGAAGLARLGLVVGRPVQPMLAQSAPSVDEALARTGPALVETKLDGMRIQVHRDGREVAVFTRSLRDVTGEVPTVVAAMASLPGASFVADGEALALAPDGRPLAFQDTMQAGGRLQPFLFDLLHLDGTDLIDAPLAERTAALGDLAPPDLRIPGLRTDAPDEATAHLRAALASGHEGVVVKSLDAPYEAGRRGAAWVKVKVAHTLDLVVLAAERGSGRRRGWLSNLHLGARDPDTGGFVMLGKTFKGLTDELLAWQTEAFLARETHREDNVVHVRPELVVEIAFDGVQRSSRYPGGVALRFARVRRYRPDKSPEQADTITTVRAIHRGELPPVV
jgi:DNA ligase 1